MFSHVHILVAIGYLALQVERTTSATLGNFCFYLERRVEKANVLNFIGFSDKLSCAR